MLAYNLSTVDSLKLRNVSSHSGNLLDKDRCYHCHQRGHFAAECPERNKGQGPKSSKGKKFEDYTYAYSGAEEPQLMSLVTLWFITLMDCTTILYHFLLFTPNICRICLFLSWMEMSALSTLVFILSSWSF